MFHLITKSLQGQNKNYTKCEPTAMPLNDFTFIASCLCTPVLSLKLNYLMSHNGVTPMNIL